MTHRHAVPVSEHPLGAQQGELLGGLVRRGGAVGMEHPMPGQVRAVLGEDAAHQPGAAWQSGTRGDVAVGQHRAGRDPGHHRANPLDRLVVHGVNHTTSRRGLVGRA